MSRHIRMMIFGLSRDTSRQEVQALVAPCGDSRLALMDLPGDNDEAMAIVNLEEDHRLAARLSDRVQVRRLHGRRLKPWLTVLPWN
jgi:hypothetical protein